METLRGDGVTKLITAKRCVSKIDMQLLGAIIISYKLHNVCMVNICFQINISRRRNQMFSLILRIDE